MKVVIIVDMQNDFIDGSLGTPEAQAIVPIMKKRLQEKYDSEDTVAVFTKDTHKDNYLETYEGINLPVEHCIEGTQGWYIHDDIAKVVDEGNFSKVTSETIVDGRVIKETFGAPRLLNIIDAIYQVRDIDEIIFMGVCTDICVISNALMCRSVFPAIPMIVEADCCAGSTPDHHEAALDVMASCQISIINRHKKEEE